MSLYKTYAEVFCYPSDGKLEHLQALCRAASPGEGWEVLGAFLEEIRPLSLGEWEELHTRTWDLSPLTPPYLGFQIWGEDYRRGKFMAALQRAYREYQIDPGSELPDHLAPVLTYLDTAAQPLPELLEIFKPALVKMAATLQKREASNPYLPLIQWLGREALPQPEPLLAAPDES
jgi:nitrate reductase molybdenum cofactor assembly chaperone NarJ/NarW